MDGCDWKGCKAESEIGYTKNQDDPKKFMCWKHWVMFTEWQENNKENDAREKIGLSPVEKLIVNKKDQIETTNYKEIRTEQIIDPVPEVTQNVLEKIVTPKKAKIPISGKKLKKARSFL